MYLWCSNCHNATHKERWRFDLGKYGICPKCGCSGHRNAIEWEYIARANGYPAVPDERTYEIQPVLF